MTWFIENLARLKAEREALEQFSTEHEWFVICGWRTNERLRLILDADIVCGGKVWPIFLQYPDLFPHTPPSVFPRDHKAHWSGHQYGVGGELCLEYGPDNWTPELSGVDLVASTRRLLEGENPSPGETGIVASRHVDTLGQRLRSEISRFVLTREAEAALCLVPLWKPLNGTMVTAFHKENAVHVLYTLQISDESTWRNPEVPPQLASEFRESNCALIRVEKDTTLPPTTSYDEFKSSCATLGLSTDGTYTILLRGNETHSYFHWEKHDTVVSHSVIPAQPVQNRLDDTHIALTNKKVGLVGCGSLGSKVATMLARSGVAKWVLADDDLLFPDNLIRNDLDWRDVGAHKAHALARRLELVNPGVEINAWKVRLGGQTSAVSADSILYRLGQCDLIIDATANPEILNILAAVAAAKMKPVIWGEVFGGGIGGLIGRCRPGIEPPLQFMRRAVENWFGDRNAPPVRPSRSYETGEDNGPMIADDADVSVIAAHTARFVTDILAREMSIFPNSVYAIGLKAGSVFSEPFVTYPIDVGPPPPQASGPTLGEDEAKAELTRLLELIKPPSNEASTPSKGD